MWTPSGVTPVRPSSARAVQSPAHPYSRPHPPKLSVRRLVEEVRAMMADTQLHVLDRELIEENVLEPVLAARAAVKAAKATGTSPVLQLHSDLQHVAPARTKAKEEGAVVDSVPPQQQQQHHHHHNEKRPSSSSSTPIRRGLVPFPALSSSPATGAGVTASTPVLQPTDGGSGLAASGIGTGPLSSSRDGSVLLGDTTGAGNGTDNSPTTTGGTQQNEQRLDMNALHVSKHAGYYQEAVENSTGDGSSHTRTAHTRRTSGGVTKPKREPLGDSSSSSTALYTALQSTPLTDTRLASTPNSPPSLSRRRTPSVSRSARSPSADGQADAEPMAPPPLPPPPPPETSYAPYDAATAITDVVDSLVLAHDALVLYRRATAEVLQAVERRERVWTALQRFLYLMCAELGLPVPLDPAEREVSGEEESEGGEGTPFMYSGAVSTTMKTALANSRDVDNRAFSAPAAEGEPVVLGPLPPATVSTKEPFLTAVATAEVGGGGGGGGGVTSGTDGHSKEEESEQRESTCGVLCSVKTTTTSSQPPPPPPPPRQRQQQQMPPPPPPRRNSAMQSTLPPSAVRAASTHRKDAAPQSSPRDGEDPCVPYHSSSSASSSTSAPASSALSSRDDERDGVGDGGGTICGNRFAPLAGPHAALSPSALVTASQGRRPSSSISSFSAAAAAGAAALPTPPPTSAPPSFARRRREGSVGEAKTENAGGDVGTRAPAQKKRHSVGDAVNGSPDSHAPSTATSAPVGVATESAPPPPLAVPSLNMKAVSQAESISEGKWSQATDRLGNTPRSTQSTPRGRPPPARPPPSSASAANKATPHPPQPSRRPQQPSPLTTPRAPSSSSSPRPRASSASRPPPSTSSKAGAGPHVPFSRATAEAGALVQNPPVSSTPHPSNAYPHPPNTRRPPSSSSSTAAVTSAPYPGSGRPRSASLPASRRPSVSRDAAPSAVSADHALRPVPRRAYTPCVLHYLYHLQQTTLQVVERIAAWRTLLTLPMPFAVEGVNYLLEIVMQVSRLARQPAMELAMAGVHSPATAGKGCKAASSQSQQLLSGLPPRRHSALTGKAPSPPPPPLPPGPPLHARRGSAPSASPSSRRSSSSAAATAASAVRSGSADPTRRPSIDMAYDNRGGRRGSVPARPPSSEFTTTGAATRGGSLPRGGGGIGDRPASGELPIRATTNAAQRRPSSHRAPSVPLATSMHSSTASSSVNHSRHLVTPTTTGTSAAAGTRRDRRRTSASFLSTSSLHSTAYEEELQERAWWAEAAAGGCWPAGLLAHPLLTPLTTLLQPYASPPSYLTWFAASTAAATAGAAAAAASSSSAADLASDLPEDITTAQLRVPFSSSLKWLLLPHEIVSGAYLREPTLSTAPLSQSHSPLRTHSPSIMSTSAEGRDEVEGGARKRLREKGAGSLADAIAEADRHHRFSPYTPREGGESGSRSSHLRRRASGPPPSSSSSPPTQTATAVPTRKPRRPSSASSTTSSMWSDSGARPGSAGGASADPVAFAHRLQQAEQALHEEVATQLECLRTCMALAVDGYYPISLTALHVLNRGAAHGAEGHQQQQLPPPRRRKTARSGSDHNGGGDGVTVWTTGSGEVMEEGQAMQRGALGLVENDHLRLLWLQELDSRLTALMEGRSSL